MKILWLFPFSKFIEISLPNLIVANKLKKENIQNTLVLCKGALKSYCNPIAASKAKNKQDVEKICKKCIQNANEFAKLNVGKTIWLDDKINGKINQNEINKIKSFCRLDNSLNKKEIISKPDAVEKKYFYAAKQSYCNAKTILDKEKPDYVISDHSLYANLNVWRWRCNVLKIPFYSCMPGPLLGSSFAFLKLSKNFSNRWFEEAKKVWAQMKTKINTISNEDIIKNHLKILKKGGHYIVYSKKENNKHPLLEKIKEIKTGYKKIVLVACSSEDEAFICSRVSGMSSPLKWLKSQNYLIRWITKHASLFRNTYFILRVHPRIAKNKRESVESSDLKIKTKLVKKLPHNVYLDFPPNQASIYSLYNVVDLVLTSWSSVGWEAQAFGLPSICLAPERSSYPSDLNSRAVNSYSDLKKALENVTTFQKLDIHKHKAFLWYCFLYKKGLIELPKILRKLGEKKHWLEGLKFRLMRLIDPAYDIHYFFEKASQQPFSVSKIKKLLENKAASLFNLQNN